LSTNGMVIDRPHIKLSISLAFIDSKWL